MDKSAFQSLQRVRPDNPIPDHVPYVNLDGSKWMPELARTLQTNKDSLQNIADKVKKTVHELPGKKQQCESVSRLKKESRLPEAK